MPAGTTPASYAYAYYGDADRDLSGTTQAGGWLKATTDPAGAFVAFAYDAAGNVVRTWDRNATAGHSLAAFPGTAAQPPSAAYAETLYGEGATALSAPWRHLRSERDPLGNQTAYTVDANGNRTAIRPPRGTAAGDASFDVTQGFDAADNLTSRTTPAGRTNGRSWTFAYDEFANPASSSDPNGNVRMWRYDSVNRLRETRWTRGADAAAAPASCATAATAADAPLPAGRYVCSTAVAYDGIDNPTATTDADGQVSTASFDALGRPTSRQQPRRDTRAGIDTVRTEARYDRDGHLTDLCPPREFTEGSGACGPTAAFSTHHRYDRAGRVVETTRYRTAGGQALITRHAYDADGNPAALTDANGHTTTRSYDLLGRKASETRPRAEGEAYTTTWSYDRAGNLTAVVRPGQRITAYAYDAANRLLGVVEGADSPDAPAAGPASGAANVRSRLEYDADGHVVARYGPRAFAASPSAPDRRFIARTDYDADGRPVAQWVPHYDAGAASAPGSAATQASQCPTGAPAYPAEVGVCVTRASYDEAGRLVRLELPTAAGSANRHLAYRYTDDDLVASVEAPSPAADGQRVQAARLVYDGSGRPVLETDANGFARKATYTADGLVATEELQPSGAVTHRTAYAYDANGNRTELVDALGHIARSSYTADDLVASHATPGGNTTSYVYDAVGNPTEVKSPSANAADATNPSGTPSTYTYTRDNLPAAVTVPVSGDGARRRRTTYGYDAGGKTSQRVEEVDNLALPLGLGDGGTQRFSYHPNDRLATETGRRGETITTTYDPAGNRIEVADSTAGGSRVRASYYLDDLLRSADDGAGASTYSYDGAGALAARDDAPAWGGAGGTRFTYNDAGLLGSARADLTGPASWARRYDPAGRLVEEVQPNGQREARTYNDDDTLARQTLTGAAGVVAEHAYTYDALLRVTSQTLAEGAQGAGGTTPLTGRYDYAYDPAGRLATFTDRGTAKQLSFDADGNRLSYGSQRFTYNADDSVATATAEDGSGLRRSEYHPFGGLRADGCRSYDYDGFDRLAKVDSGIDPTLGLTQPPCPSTSPTTYAYDGLDRQRSRTVNSTALGSTTTAFHHDGLGQGVLAESQAGAAAGATTASVLDPAGIPKAVATTTGTARTELLSDDGQGSVATVVDLAGQVTCTARFDPYGDPQRPSATDPDGVCNTGSTANDSFYRGARRDRGTGAYQLGSRTYDPKKAGFLTPDSYRAEDSAQDVSVGVDPLTRNRYSYVNGDPVNLVDPDGHARCRLSDVGCHRRNVEERLRRATKATADFVARHKDTLIKAGAVVATAVAVGAVCAGTAGTGCGAAVVAGGAVVGSAIEAVDCPTGNSTLGCAAKGAAVGAVSGAVAVAVAPAGAVTAGAGAVARSVLAGGAAGAAGEATGQAIKGDFHAGRLVAASIAGGAAAGILHAGAVGVSRLAPRAVAGASATSERVPAGAPQATLYRAVSKAELDDIAANGFRANERSMSGKFFAETPEHAAEWGRRLIYGKEGVPFHVVETRVPTSFAGRLMRWDKLDGIGPARYVDDLDELNRLRSGVVDLPAIPRG